MKGESSSDQDETQGYKRSTGAFLQDSDVKLRRKERVPKCCVVGDGGTGKTSMMMRYTLGKILSDYQPTCFENYTIDIKEGENTHQLSVLDTAGQETYRSSAYACVLRYRRICRLLLRARQRLIGKRETKMDSRNQTVQTRHTLFHCGNTHRLASFRGGHNERLCEYG